MNFLITIIEYSLSYRCKRIQYTKLCSICLEREKNTAFFRCGHKCVCDKCAIKIINQPRKDRKCPICRREIVGKLKIYE